MKEDWGLILQRWNIDIPPHLPLTTLLCDHELGLFVFSLYVIFGNGKVSLDKIVL